MNVEVPTRAECHIGPDQIQHIGTLPKWFLLIDLADQK